VKGWHSQLGQAKEGLECSSGGQLNAPSRVVLLGSTLQRISHSGGNPPTLFLPPSYNTVLVMILQESTITSLGSHDVLVFPQIKPSLTTTSLCQHCEEPLKIHLKAEG